MNEPRSLEDLLDLQGVDLEIDRLLERRGSLPELERYREVHDRAEELAREVQEKEELARETRLAVDKGEGELELLEQKLEVEERRLYAGGLSARETEHLRQEVESLRRRVGGMEEEVLELLDRREREDAELEEVRARLEEARAEERRLQEAITEEWRKIDAEIARKESRKADLVPLVEPSLLELYEELRRTKEGTAVGRLGEGVCGGCHLRLSAAEQAQVLREDPPRCIHCRRILVPQ